MSPIPIKLATGDELREVGLRRVLHGVRRGYQVGTAYRRGGFGYLRKTVHGWNRAARGVPFLLLTDLDSWECPRSLIDSWLLEPQQANLLFRVAVREVEAWLLADSENLGAFLGVAPSSVPSQPEILNDPKGALIDLARKSRSANLRDRLVPARG